MKPLFFPVVLLSPLDAAIWLEVDARMDGEREYALHVEARKADRRDAALMLEMLRSRLIPVYDAPMAGGAHARVVWWEL